MQNKFSLNFDRNKQDFQSFIAFRRLCIFLLSLAILLPIFSNSAEATPNKITKSYINSLNKVGPVRWSDDLARVMINLPESFQGNILSKCGGLWIFSSKNDAQAMRQSSLFPDLAHFLFYDPKGKKWLVFFSDYADASCYTQVRKLYIEK